MDEDTNNNREKWPFLIKGVVGLFIVKAVSPTKALVSFWINEIPLSDCFITRDDLMKRGYNSMQTTEHDQVFMLLPGEKI